MRSTKIIHLIAGNAKKTNFNGRTARPYQPTQPTQQKMKLQPHQKIASDLQKLLQRKHEIGEPLPVVPERRAREIMALDKALNAAQAVAKAREESDAAITASMELETIDEQIWDVCEALGKALEPLKNERSAKAKEAFEKSLNRWLNGEGKGILDEAARAFVFVLTAEAEPALQAANDSAKVPQIFVGSKSGVNWKSWRCVRPSWRAIRASGGSFETVDSFSGGGDDDSLLQLAEHVLTL
jgi:hypothetical protein